MLNDQFKAAYSFNSRTRVGCDLAFHNASILIHCFNSRTRVGCDPVLRYVSPFENCFNSRTRVGCDFSLPFLHLTEIAFQFTHPRGVRHHCKSGL